MANSKNFFYRVEPLLVLAEMICVPADERGDWAVRFFRDLQNGDPDKTGSTIAADIIREAHEYRNRRAKAGQMGGVAKSSNRVAKSSNATPEGSNAVASKQLAVSSKQLTEEDQKPSSSADEGFYLSRRKRKLQGKRLETFELFWKAFGYKSGRAEAADAWLDIPELTQAIVDKIVIAAKNEAANRSGILAQGKTPKMAQGWLSGRRWEDEISPPDPPGPLSSEDAERIKRTRAKYE